MRELDGHLRFDTAGELDVLNRIWELDCVFTNYLLAQQKLVFKQRHGATVKKRHDLATTTAPSTEGPEPEWLRRRRHAIYALVVLCVLFLVCWITFDFVQAAQHGFGSGFGDGHIISSAAPRPHGTGFCGDLLRLNITLAVDAVLLGCWYWLLSRLDSPSDDDLVTPLPEDLVDKELDSSWYIVKVPKVTTTLVALATGSLILLALLGAAILPTALIRFGWN